MRTTKSIGFFRENNCNAFSPAKLNVDSKYIKQIIINNSMNNLPAQYCRPAAHSLDQERFGIWWVYKTPENEEKRALF